VLNSAVSRVLVLLLVGAAAGASAAQALVITRRPPIVAHGALQATKVLPLTRLPATVSRGRNAERGTLTLALPSAAPTLKVKTRVTSGAPGRIGTVTKSGGQLVFKFTSITYDVAPIALPGQPTIDSQTITLDPARPSTLRINLRTGRITRDFHWLLRGTNVRYNGSPILPLGDTGSSRVATVTKLGASRYSIRLLTDWKTQIILQSWTVDGQALQGGVIHASAVFDGAYLLHFVG
jgi:hypothetical protein